MILYEAFYRAHGVRLISQLTSPPLADLATFEFPRNSLFHYTTDSAVESGPDTNNILFSRIERPILLINIKEFSEDKGNVRKSSTSADSLISQYRSKHRRFRILRDAEVEIKDVNSLVVYNYALLNSVYKYPRSLYTDYFKWLNNHTALCKTIAHVAMTSDRNQFVYCNIPEVLPSVRDLITASHAINQTTIKKFTNGDSLFILDLWKWLGEERATSGFNLIPKEHLNKINLIYQDAGKWFVINLGKINSWRAATKEELKADPTLSDKGFASQQVQKRYLRLLITLFEVKTLDVDVNKELASVVKEVTDDVENSENETTNSVNIITGDEHNQPDSVVEDIVHDEQFDAALDEELKELETLSDLHSSRSKDEELVTAKVADPAVEVTVDNGVLLTIDRLAEDSGLSAAEYKKHLNAGQKYKTILSPDGVTTLDQFVKIDPEVLVINESPKITDISTVIDKTMLSSSHHAFTSRYVEKVLEKDVAGMVLNIQKAGISVTDYKVEKITDVLGSYNSYTVKIAPVVGTPSTLMFRIPTVNEDGTYVANKIKYRLRLQRGDIPIRKVASDRVALTSYYGKVFISRSPKRINSYSLWLNNVIMAKGLDPENPIVTSVNPGLSFDNSKRTPRVFSALAMNYLSFNLLVKLETQSIQFVVSFTHTERETLYGKDMVTKYEKDGAVIAGEATDGALLVIDTNNVFYYTTNDEELQVIGQIEDILGVEHFDVPTDFAEVKVLGNAIPVGFILAYELGLDNLIQQLGVQVRRVPVGTRVGLSSDELALVFSDETLVYDRFNKLASMILSGFNEYKKTIREYSIYDFDNRGVYLNVLSANGLSIRYLREIDLIYKLFVDSITYDLLVELKEPTDFKGLLFRSSELLLTDDHPDEFDPAYMRIKGYERFAGAVYSEVVKSIRQHAGLSANHKKPIDLNPFAVWRNISKDPSISLISDINPIENIRQSEAVTYAGTGGRNGRTMVKHTRVYHPNDIGTISEGTVDSSDVAINTYTSADPQLTSLRGVSKRYVIGKTGATALFSTAALVSVGSDHDDPKRVNYAGIQHAHAIACSGYTQSQVRTGYEQIVAHRTGNLFAATAKQKGTVTSVTKTGITITYEDGSVKGYETGRIFGAAAGITIPHNVVTDLKVGDTVDKDSIISYNTGFFERDILNPKNVIWKNTISVKTVLLESAQTLEDSSAISKRAAELLSTKITKVKDIVVRFDQTIHNLVNINDELKPDNILCVIEDVSSNNSTLFDEVSIDTLKILGSQSPQAKVRGTVEAIEVYYHGSIEDMPPSLREIATASDKRFRNKFTSVNKEAYTGSVDSGFRIDGDMLALDTMTIRIFITTDVAAGVGD